MVQDSTKVTTDLQLIDQALEEIANEGLSPQTFRKLQEQNLIRFIDRLNAKNLSEAKAFARARMAQAGYYVDDPEIANIAQHIESIKNIKIKISMCSDLEKLTQLCADLIEHVKIIRQWFK